jgi:hypothetical protein
MKLRNKFIGVWLALVLSGGLAEARAQGATGGNKKPTPTPTPAPTTPPKIINRPPRPTPTPRPPSGPRPAPRPVSPTPSNPPRPATTPASRQPESEPPEPTAFVGPPPCKESGLVVRCGVPGCDVLVDGEKRGFTDENGELHVPVARGKHTVIAAKAGYEPVKTQVEVGCGAGEPANVILKTRPYAVRLRTNLPACDIFRNGAPAGRSDEQGLFVFTANEIQILAEARKDGYLGGSATVTPENAGTEIRLELRAVPARLYLTANVAEARARLDEQGDWLAIDEPLSLSPGPHTVTVEALGFAPATLSLTPAANEKLERQVELQPLPVAELLAQADALFKRQDWGQVQALCRHVFKADAGNAAAHRLSGLAYLANQNYAQAEPHLLRALRGGASFAVRVRRHAQEKFELGKGHDACLGALTLSAGGLEYRGQTVTAENFTVTKAQVQIVGLQVKKDAALCLSLKIADAQGKNRRDYNFFAPEKELSAEGKPYLEMLHRLLQAL